jgi:preprotein translocase subunit SecA
MGRRGLEKRLESEFFLKLPVADWVRDGHDARLRRDRAARDRGGAQEYEAKFAPVEGDVARHYERAVMLQSIDTHWREHLAALDYLRQGIHLRGYAQKQPKQEYKREAFELFAAMLDSIKREVSRHLMAVQIRTQEQVEEAERRAEEAARAVKNIQYQHPDIATGVSGEPPEAARDSSPRRPWLPMNRPSPSRARRRRSAATTRAPAARARSSSTATAASAERPRRGRL